MKVILLKDIPKIGKKYDVKDVADGHALNMLMPRGLVRAATSDALKKVEEMKARDLAEKRIQGELLAKNLESIKDLKVVLKEKANDKGHLFAGITKEMLSSEIQKIARINVDPESIKITKPLKEVGEHKVTVSAMDKKVEFTVTVEAV
jgi:large subunit ribosomal protein L9